MGKQLLFHLSPSPVCARLHYSQRLKSTGENTAEVKKEYVNKDVPSNKKPVFHRHTKHIARRAKILKMLLD